MKNNKKIILCIFLVIILGIFYIINIFFDKEEIRATSIEKVEVKEEVAQDSELVKVDIKGAVKNPGVYEVSVNNRVIDVIKIAGGLNKSANTEYINLAKNVTDEMIIWIYTDSEIREFMDSNVKYEYIEKECHCPDVDSSACINENNGKDKVNINTATKEELMTLSGIGEAKALSIIEYRENTPFKTIEDLKNISGIGDSIFTEIKDFITV